MTDLYYAFDPMCSWCFAFEPTKKKLFSALKGKVHITPYVGGLAPDTDQPMDPQMVVYLQRTWKHVEKQVPGTKFNFRFWDKNIARRSTYPACRAVITAAKMAETIGSDPEQAMLSMNESIQLAYYKKAQNPSNLDTLVLAAENIGLDGREFAALIDSDEIRSRHREQMRFCQNLAIDSYPSLRLVVQGEVKDIPIDYKNAKSMLNLIKAYLEEE